MKIFKDSIKTIIVSLIFLVLIGIAHAWTEPGGNPPTSNTSAPVVTGSSASPVAQTKYGDLTIIDTAATGNINAYGPLTGQNSASALQLAATDSNNYWHLGYRGTASGETGNLSAWYYNGVSWIAPLKLTPLGDAIINRNLTIGGNANVCKKVVYGTTGSVGCGVNYYVVNVMDSSGNFANPTAPPQSGIMLCCKNAD